MFDEEKFFEENGYLIFDFLDEHSCDAIINDVLKSLESESPKKNPNIYHYNSNPRIIEAWKWSENIKSAALNPVAINLLKKLYHSEPIPFSTIKLIKSTEQPFHSDAFHFEAVPEHYLAAIWIALEDINDKAGPLMIPPKSHKLPYLDCGDLGLSPPSTREELKLNNTNYENYVKEAMACNDLEAVIPKLNKGKAVLWHSNLLHGSVPGENSKLSRHSMVTHYHFESADFFYNPNFSCKKGVMR